MANIVNVFILFPFRCISVELLVMLLLFPGTWSPRQARVVPTSYRASLRKDIAIARHRLG